MLKLKRTVNGLYTSNLNIHCSCSLFVSTSGCPDVVFHAELDYLPGDVFENRVRAVVEQNFQPFIQVIRFLALFDTRIEKLENRGMK